MPSHLLIWCLWVIFHVRYKIMPLESFWNPSDQTSRTTRTRQVGNVKYYFIVSMQFQKRRDSWKIGVFIIISPHLPADVVGFRVRWISHINWNAFKYERTEPKPPLEGGARLPKVERKRIRLLLSDMTNRSVVGPKSQLERSRRSMCEKALSLT